MNPYRLAAGGVIAMAIVFGFGRFVYTPILPHMIADGLSASSAGLVAAMNYLGYFAGALLGATGVMQARARTWFIASLLVSGLGMIAMATTQNIILYSILRFLSGAGGANIMVAGATLMYQPLAMSRQPWLSMLPFSGVGLGIAISSWIVAILAHQGAHWPLMWTVTGAIATAGTFVVAMLIPAAPAATMAVNATFAERLIWTRRLVLLTIGYGLFGFGYVITATFIVVITRETPILQPLEPYVWIIVGLAGAVSIPFWTWIARRVGDVPTFATMMVAEGTGVALSVVSPTPATVVIAAILLGGTIMAITGIGLQIGRRLAKGGTQRIQAIMTAAFGLGQVVGPLIAGHLRETTGSFLLPSLAAAAALAIGAVLALIP